MASQVSICNLALSRIGIKKYIDSIDERSDEARVLKQVWTEAVEQALAVAPWPFAIRRAALAPDSGTVPEEWGYAFTYPADCVHAIRIEDSLQVRRPDEATAFAMEGAESGTARRIVCDVEEPVLVYVARILHVPAWTPEFRDALAWLLAAEIAMPLVGTQEVAEYARKMWWFQRNAAMASYLTEQTPPAPPVSELEASRL